MFRSSRAKQPVRLGNVAVISYGRYKVSTDVAQLQLAQAFCLSTSHLQSNSGLFNPFSSSCTRLPHPPDSPLYIINFSLLDPRRSSGFISSGSTSSSNFAFLISLSFTKTSSSSSTLETRRLAECTSSNSSGHVGLGRGGEGGELQSSLT